MKFVTGVIGVAIAVTGVGNLFVGAQTFAVPTTASPSSNRIEVVTVSNPHSNYALASGFILIVLGTGLTLSSIIPEDGVSLPEAQSKSEAVSVEPPLSEPEPEEDDLDLDIENYLSSVLN